MSSVYFNSAGNSIPHPEADELIDSPKPAARASHPLRSRRKVPYPASNNTVRPRLQSHPSSQPRNESFLLKRYPEWGGAYPVVVSLKLE
jgi:hypothetical protein